jgi:hypothetical protein
MPLTGTYVIENYKMYSTISHNAYGRETEKFMHYEKYSVTYL